MKVHIVCPDYADLDRKILGRKAMALVDQTGWTIATGPDPRADINYFMPYIMLAQEYPSFKATATAAYFTHRETGRWKKKQEWWDGAAQLADLRLTSSTHNLQHLRPHGPTMLVPRPPIDLEAYTPTGEGRQRVIGLSGFVDRVSGRKGEARVAKLAGGGVPLEAIGQGWPVPTTLVDFAEIPHFYNRIWAYLCSATLEGVPMTVLEALACGTPVIIPLGVGIMDDLPEMAGIYRYDPENYASMKAACVAALDSKPPDPWVLRTAVAGYTAANWAQDHIDAFERFLHPRPVTSNQWRGKSGMYCVAFGKPSRRCAVKCIQSFKAHMPGVPVAFAGAAPLNVGEDVFVERPDIDIGGRLGKLAVYDAAPQEWEHVLYLDADTETVGDISFLFQLLADGWETLICKDMAKYHTAKMMKRPDNHVEYEETMNLLGCGDVMQYNGGVFGFRRCENVERFFLLWQQEWQKYGARDQGALLRALYKNPLRLWLLGNQWNASDRYPWPAGEVAVIHHNMRARRWGGLIYGRTDDAAAWDKVKKWEAANL